MISAAVVGGTGYTGAELLRLLVDHPEVKLQVVTSRSSEGVPLADSFVHLRGKLDLCFSKPDSSQLRQCDVVFFATPNGTAMQMVPELFTAGVKIIDLAADFRLQDAALWESFYGMPHACPELLAQAVYGLPELNRERIATAQLVANPGCYPTAVSLGFLPLLAHSLVRPESLIADAKSGVSGAGRQSKIPNLYAELAENFKAYGVGVHRHRPEIIQTLNSVTGQSAANPRYKLVFVPHLVPMIRGIHATLYAHLNNTDVDLQELFESYYTNEHFVDVLPAGSHPETGSVRGSNKCRLAVHRLSDSDMVVILAVEDNLVKGAAGQAVQNMNIMFGLNETLGLETPALWP